MLQLAGFCVMRLRTAVVAYGFLFLVNIMVALGSAALQTDALRAQAAPQTIVTIEH
jgi:hypothetical protein